MHTCISRMYKSPNYTLIHTCSMCACTHRETHTNTKHTSRLSLCFQLPDGPRGNQNFDTPGWKKESREARQCQRRTRARRRARPYTDTWQRCTQAQTWLSSRRQAKVYRECKNMTLRGGKKLCSSVHSHVLLKKNLQLPQGRWACVGGVGELLWPNYLLLFHETIHGCSWGDFPVVCFRLCGTVITERVLLKWCLMTPCPHKCLYLGQLCHVSSRFLSGKQTETLITTTLTWNRITNNPNLDHLMKVIKLDMLHLDMSTMAILK